VVLQVVLEVADLGVVSSAWSWGVMVESLGVLGHVLGHLGASLCRAGPILKPSWAYARVLGEPLTHVPWEPRFLSVLEVTSIVEIRAILGASWAGLGVILGYCSVIL
jgi:hypothetical protein